jgi:hypothetical protein
VKARLLLGSPVALPLAIGLLTMLAVVATGLSLGAPCEWRCKNVECMQYESGVDYPCWEAIPNCCPVNATPIFTPLTSDGEVCDLYYGNVKTYKCEGCDPHCAQVPCTAQSCVAYECVYAGSPALRQCQPKKCR